MIRLVLLLCCLGLAGPMSASAGGIPLPGEWEGIWTEVDSVYDCGTQSLIRVVSRTDTLCAGEEVGVDPGLGSPSNVTTCTGTGDATHLQSHCTAFALAGEACQVSYVSDLDATRSSDSALWIWTATWTFTPAGCQADRCAYTRRHGTRLQAGPLAACGAVPTRPATWGNLRARYR